MPGALPQYGDYLRDVISLGKRSVVRTVPALAFLYFYRLGMGLFLALQAQNVSPDDAAHAVLVLVMVMCGYIPLIFCLFAPMLPVEDAILRGEAIGFWEGIRRVIRVMGKLVASQIVQAIIVAGPIGLLAGAALAVAARPGAILPQLGASAAILAVIPAFFWFLVASFLLVFALPALVLDLEGPIQSIRTSARLTRRHFGGVFGRMFVYICLSFLVAMVASAPSSILNAALAAAGNENPMLKIPGVIWESAVEALLFPFGVAAVVVLYRALAPRTGGTAPATLLPEEERLRANPFPFE